MDTLEIEKDLTDEELGMLFRAIIKVQKGVQIDLPKHLSLVFSIFKAQFKRDNEKYEKIVDKRKIAGSKGGKQRVANASKCKQKVANQANQADSVSVSVNDSVSVSDSVNRKNIYMTDTEFDKFWSEYPNKQNKKKSREKFLKLKLSLFDKIMEQLERFKESDDWIKNDGMFIPHPTTWINGERWEDEINNESDDNLPNFKEWFKTYKKK